MSETSLALMSRASRMLAEATTIQRAKELKDLALTAQDWARRKGMGDETIRQCRTYALLAQRKMGELLAATERATGTRGQLKGRDVSGGAVTLPPEERVPTLAELGLTKRESAEAQTLAAIPEPEFQAVLDEGKTVATAVREVKRRGLKEGLESVEAKEVKAAEGVYDVIVIDPPWPMQKIQRDCRPNQSLLDYPTMTEAELRELAIPAADDCHVWLWTTQKFLPMAFRLLDAWGLRYCCCFVWHKPGGFQPVGLPQYNAEFALYARRGSPKFLETKALPVCFDAPRGRHSEKPEAFYEVVRRVTAGRRLDMFSRRRIDGFDGWGKEAE
ncbi:MAG: MT-A70 family methyltransferase [Planctomycetota bacterium]